MTLLERLGEDLKRSMKAGAGERVSLLRYLLAQIHNREIEKRTTPESPLKDEEVIEVLQKDRKKRSESIELFKKGDRDDLVRKEEKELAIIDEYLPRPMSLEEIHKVIEEVVSSHASDFATAMRESMKRLKGHADGKIVSELVKQALEKRR